MLGDFNARVGSSSSNEDEWRDVRGPHGIGELNSSGEQLLSFLAVNGAYICNTWFMKRENLKATWQHPRTRKSHCIDYCIRP